MSFLGNPFNWSDEIWKRNEKYRVLRLFSGETIVSNKLYVLKTLFYSSSHIRVWQIFKWFCLQRQGLRVENILRCRFFPTHTISKGCSGAEKEIRSKIDFFALFLSIFYQNNSQSQFDNTRFFRVLSSWVLHLEVYNEANNLNMVEVSHLYNAAILWQKVN